MATGLTSARSQLGKLSDNGAAEALEEAAKNPRHVGTQECGFFGVLHTWGRDLSYHPHCHFVAPAGGLDANGAWTSSRAKNPDVIDCSSLSSIGVIAITMGGDDHVDGTSQADQLFGGDGQDTLIGNGGDDRIGDEIWVSKSGYTTNHGTTISSPLPTVSAAVKLATAGTTINIEGGNGPYHEQVLIEDRSGTASSRILIKGYGTEPPVIDGRDEFYLSGLKYPEWPHPNPDGTYLGLVEIRNCQHLTLENVQINNSRKIGLLMRWSDTSKPSCRISKLRIARSFTLRRRVFSFRQLPDSTDRSAMLPARSPNND